MKVLEEKAKKNVEHKKTNAFTIIAKNFVREQLNTQISDKKYKETLRMTAEKPRQQILKIEVKMPHVKSCHRTKKQQQKTKFCSKTGFSL